MEQDFYAFWMTFLWQIPLRKLWDWTKLLGGARALYEAREETLPLATKREQEYIRRAKEREDILEMWEKRKKQSYRFLSWEHKDYPERLRELTDAPFGIYCEGCLPKAGSPLVAIVGSRSCTVYGREFARQTGEELARQGVGVVSGLAAGIDGAGHRGCMDGGGYTLGVLGSGIRTVYPRENYGLYMDMRERGGILTEYAPDIKPLPPLFPRRNRIISALSDFVLVVEARERSGSLITADLALEQGRDVGAVPGRPCDSLSQGCDRLIQQGARCVLTAEDILEELAYRGNLPMGREAAQQKNSCQVNPDLGLAPKEKMVYSCLRLEPEYIDDILCRLELPVWEGIQLLSELEVKGIIKQNPHHYFFRTR